MTKEVMVRVPEKIIERLRELSPELKHENNAVLVRTALNKLISQQEKYEKGGT
jgi:predicted DNA-binding protein